MPKPQELFDIDGEIVAETEKAWLIFDGTKKEWLPKSQCEIEEKQDGTVVVTMPTWLAKAKGFL